MKKVNIKRRALQQRDFCRVCFIPIDQKTSEKYENLCKICYGAELKNRRNRAS
jgi:hypothetical protein